ncbi:hypothetical protein ZWY2020_029005 [Hordeum vulgare]|nr:hypothetical protein ZWY2020_029005 [Hordeum vulgare]
MASDLLVEFPWAAHAGTVPGIVVENNGREHRRDLDEVRDPGDLVVVECLHDVLGAWWKAAPRSGAGVDHIGSHMMIMSPLVGIACKMLNGAMSA